MNLVLCLILTVAVLAPSPEITGTVVDEHGKVVSGISISAVSVISGQTLVARKAVSAQDGSFSFTDLAPGSYYGLTAKTESSCAISNPVRVAEGFTSVVHLRLVKGLCGNALVLHRPARR